MGMRSWAIQVVGTLVICNFAWAFGTAAPNAYFLLTFDMLSSPSWPADYKEYSLFITSPSHFTKALVEKVHADIGPHAKVLAYFDSVNIPLVEGCSTGSPMGNNPVQRQLRDDPDGYFKDLRSGFNSSWLMRNLSTSPSSAVCFFPGLASYVIKKDTIDFLVDFHTKVTIARYGFDGLYVDMLTDSWWIGDYDTKIATDNLDIDGDGLKNTVLDVETQWKGWRPYLVGQLRKSFGAEKIIIANAAGAMSMLGLNGITIEMEACGTDYRACLSAVESSRAVAQEGGLAPVDVFWLTQAQQVPPATQCKLVTELVARFDDGSVYGGSDWYDGSHIVCNSTSALPMIAV